MLTFTARTRWYFFSLKAKNLRNFDWLFAFLKKWDWKFLIAYWKFVWPCEFFVEISSTFHQKHCESSFEMSGKFRRNSTRTMCKFWWNLLSLLLHNTVLFFTRRPGKKRFFWLSISQATRQTKPDHDFTQFVCFVGGFLPSNKLI